MKIVTEIKVLSVEKYKPFTDENGKVKESDVLYDVLIETQEKKMGIFVPATLKIGSTLEEKIPIGIIKVELTVSPYIHNQSKRATLSVKIVKVLK